MKQELFDLGAQIIKDAENHGVNQAEAYLTSRKILIIQVEKGAIKTAEEKLDMGCAIRAIVNQKLGFSYTSTRNPSDIQALTKEAVTLAKISLPDAALKAVSIKAYGYGGIVNLYCFSNWLK